MSDLNHILGFAHKLPLSLMNTHHVLLIVHLIAATVWVGGHLLLVTSYVPRAIKLNDAQIILNFESLYERLGMGSLIVLVASGIAMAYVYGVSPGRWFRFESGIETVVSVKLSLLLATVLFAVSARFVAIPRLKAGKSGLVPMTIHIIGVTTIGVAMVIFGSFIRFGGL